MSCEPGTFPDQTAFLGVQSRYLAADKLVADGFVAVGVDLVGIGDIPGAACDSVVVGHCFRRRGVLRSVGVEGVSVFVLRAAYLARSWPSVNLEDGIVGTVDVRVDTKTQEVFVIVCVDSGVDFGAPSFGVFAWVHGIGVENAGELDLKLDRAVLMEIPIDAIFVVGSCEDVRDDEFSATGYNDGVISKIGMLEQNAGVLFMHADGVLDGLARPGAVDEVGVHVVYGSFAITTQRQTVGHVSSAIFAKIESMLSLVRMFWVAVGYHHLRKGQSIEDASLVALVIVGDVVQDNAFSIVKPNMNLPILPFNDSSVDCEGYAFGLGDVEWL